MAETFPLNGPSNKKYNEEKTFKDFSSLPLKASSVLRGDKNQISLLLYEAARAVRESEMTPHETRM